MISGQKRTINASAITRNSIIIGVITQGRLALLDLGLGRKLELDLTLVPALVWETNDSAAEASRVAGIRLVPQKPQ